MEELRTPFSSRAVWGTNWISVIQDGKLQVHHCECIMRWWTCSNMHITDHWLLYLAQAGISKIKQNSAFQRESDGLGGTPISSKGSCGLQDQGAISNRTKAELFLQEPNDKHWTILQTHLEWKTHRRYFTNSNGIHLWHANTKPLAIIYCTWILWETNLTCLI